MSFSRLRAYHSEVYYNTRATLCVTGKYREGARKKWAEPESSSAITLNHFSYGREDNESGIDSPTVVSVCEATGMKIRMQSSAARMQSGDEKSVTEKRLG